ncbi:hypothetical protein PAMP_016120 [Pampus punctatissimus]
MRQTERQTESLHAERHHGKHRTVDDITSSLSNRWNVAEGPTGQSETIIHRERQTGSQEGRNAQEEEGQPPHATAERNMTLGVFILVDLWQFVLCQNEQTGRQYVSHLLSACLRFTGREIQETTYT